ncbi:hypothetical protein BDW22DRAFT_606971 [Trametopsis cervina]|nr:hypothetical protein BDW22DRAFT_606971 [Trametopsis cervina]
MRNTLPLLSRPPQAGHSQAYNPQAQLDTSTPTQQIPTIRFIAATPSEQNISRSAVAPFASSPLAPRQDKDTPRKRLVPKKSKLGLLGGSKSKEKSTKDFSDVLRRVGADTPSNSRGGFEIYVDHDEDADMGSIVVVKKKKSRLGINGMKWGALGEVTNVPSAPKEKPSQENLLKVKGDENQKWWSIGRGRKDTKEKSSEKPQVRAKTPEPLKPTDTRARFNSLDAGIALSTEPKPQSVPQRKSSVATLLGVPDLIRSQTPSSEAGLLAPPTNESTTGSIAVRAMRSMRSLARMKSWANMGSTISDKEGNASTTTNTNMNTNTSTTVTTSKTKEKSDEKEKKKKKEKKEKKESKEGKKEKKTVRLSGSSFEAGALSSQGSPAPPAKEAATVQKKQSKLGLGLPSTMRLGTTRNVSHASSVYGIPQQPATVGNRLSIDSAHLIMGANGRPASSVSSGSSLRPPSTASGVSAFSERSPRSSSSSVASVRWDERGLQTVKEMQRRERQTRRQSAEDKAGRSSREGRESRRNSDGRRRAAIADVFPEVRQRSVSPPSTELVRPIVTVEEATADGHEDVDVSIASGMSTPIKRARPRPLSEQLLGKDRPKPMADDSDGVLSILDAATNDLASLINRLDLEATPASRNNSPLKRSPLSLRRSPSTMSLGRPGDGSPSKVKYTFNKDTDAPLLESASSISSLRPYAQLQAAPLFNPAPPTRQQAMAPADARKLIGQQIVPWSSLDWQVSPKKPAVKPKTGAFRPTHKRTLTPAPAIEPPPVFQPLHPAAKNRVSEVESLSLASTPANLHAPSNPSSRTFGSRTNVSKVGLEPSDDDDDGVPPSPSPVVKRHKRHSRKASVLSAMCDSGAILPPEALKSLGLTGTLGGQEPEVNPEDPDSDIPDELQTILSGQSDDESAHAHDDTLSYKSHSRPPTPGMPPLVLLPKPDVAPPVEEYTLPIFRATVVDTEEHETDVDDSAEFQNEDDTSKSFDFTGELQKLNDSGASDRRSFVEQLENAFRTPARVDLGFDLFVKEDVPEVPAMPLMHRETPGDDIAPRSVDEHDMSSFNNMDTSQDQSLSYRDSAASDTLDNLIAECEEDICRQYPKMHHSQSSMRSKESDGKLNTSFRFGGRPSMSDISAESPEKPLTLSDIIPPLNRHTQSQSSLVEEDSSVLKSILAQAYEDDTSVVKSILAEATDVFPAPEPRPRVDSDTSSKRNSLSFVNVSKTSSHSRNTSEASFTGFDSFDEVRRGFEFGPNRPAFYPPPGATSHKYHNRYESIYSIASVSSYGATLNSGAFDPFGYAGEGRPISDDMSASMSINIDDTFSFLKKDPHRKRVDSDASSFYFRGAAASHPHRRSHRRNESNFSVTSNAPPVSLYNRSFGAHKRNDSSGSISSVAQSYAMHGSFGGRAAWARHHHEPSTDSIMSEYSVARLGRPGVGDKMFDMDYGMPLSAISGSPAESTFSDRYNQQTNYDSIFDSEINEPKTSVEDSIFEKTGDKSSYADETDNVFEMEQRSSQDEQEEAYMRLRQFRPLSMLSIASSHTGPKEDDTMISMLGGGHVRRRSIDSGIKGSPCIALERKKNTALQHLARVLRFDQPEDELHLPDRLSKVSPDKVIQQKPSIASTSSHHFGGERMIQARKGLLERPSLDDSALIAQGEEILHSLQSARVFSRPVPVGRSRSSTCTSSSGAETPPLSTSDNSSVSSGSQSSIDLGHLNTLLTNVTYPASGIARARTVRARARGNGHRRRISQARASRTSVYETIQEESVVLSSSPSLSLESASPPSTVLVKPASAEIPQDSIFIVDADSAEYEEHWDEESGVMSMRRYFALKEEAHETVTESKRVWEDTAFSLFAVQSFQPPKNKTGMQALLEHSKQNYGPLPSELRPHRVRSRTSSRPSPYPVRQRVSVSPPEQSYGAAVHPFAHPEDDLSTSSIPLREISINPNMNILSYPPAIEAEVFSPFAVELEKEKSKPERNALGLPRPRVSSTARRTALGWSKRSTGKTSSGKTSSGKTSTGKVGNSNKENATQGVIMTPSDSLRLSRPRPRGRPTPARKAVPAA